MPVEIIFDQGLGDIFVVRVAGNVLDSASHGSIEYAVHHLDVKVVMVLPGRAPPHTSSFGIYCAGPVPVRESSLRPKSSRNATARLVPL